MIGLLQRVSEAGVVVNEEEIAAIGAGLLVLVGVEKGDGEPQADRLLERLLGYRVFPDAAGRMNRSLADTASGRRAPVRVSARAGAAAASPGGGRAVRCRHAGAIDERWSGHLLAQG